MEQARLLLAIVLSLLVFLAWNYFFVEPQAPPIKPQNAQNDQKLQEEKPQADSENDSAVDISKSESAGVNNDTVTADVDEGPSRTLTIETPLYIAKIDEKGAAITSFVLKQYYENVGANSPPKELILQDKELRNVNLSFEKNSISNLEDRRFKANSENDKIDVKDRTYELGFSFVSDDGIRVEKKFIFNPNSYIIDLAIAINNQSGHTLKDQLVLSLTEEKEDKKQSYVFEGPSALIDGKHEQLKIKKDNVPEPLNGDIQWIAFEKRYFLSSIIAKDLQKAQMKVKIEDDRLINQYLGPQVDIDNSEQKVYEYAVFFGPKKQDLLKSLDFNLSRVIDFGFFDFLAKPFLWFLNFIYSVIPNYGISIILLTLLTKIILWPLGNKSYKSMNEMKRLQPLMEEIREKYKDDKAKMNQEIMGLYRTYKINPMGGCLPMILQIPVFFALYRMLYQAIELRHAPFIWWINDLSAPDRLLHFNFAVPFMQPPFGIPVLTIVMGATMLLQQKMSPPPGDPAQAKMMMIMPVVFTFIFINFSSGLVLYWLVNNILSIGQQYYIQKKYA